MDQSRSKHDELEKAAQAKGAAMYQQQDAQNDNQKPDDDNVVDAEFNEK
jgi:hypothetical protein